jgi:effector-binding domain-containing protein
VVGEATIVDRDPVQVMFKRVADEESAIGKGIAEVEDAVGSLGGRKCYGAFADGEYPACVQVREDDDPAAIGLEVGELPGGRYARVRLKGESPNLYRLIGPTFGRLAQRRDTTRPGIESYRRHDVIDLLLPID